ncbi:PREDICTED: putative F-box protein At3g19560 [Brassica oleracea var. oleracea]|uniref:F-box associated beta-propeller type 1 domain-containing protein n=2 Tax=Brassica oleracea TaxID=3712 RepID=A0A0D3CID8_BRAOL|nr:PREDICTED: putative F-box protein At3g19560 [Brassica oleracea var. oleracea]VDD45708.1 unnamed protein product [Brassica oleracea]
MTKISDLSQDLIEEILSRVQLTSRVRSTCKQWNGLYKDESFTKKHLGKAANDTMLIMVCDSRVFLASVDLQGLRKQKRGFVELSTKPIGQLNQITVSDHVYHWDGLLFCLPRIGLPVVCNPYLGQVRQIKPRKKLNISGSYKYCVGYDNSNNHKILRFLNHFRTVECDIYDLKSDSWRALEVTPDWIMEDYYQMGLTLKGNTYIVAQNRKAEMRDFLICFDFTSERFRHCLDLQSYSNSYPRNRDSVILSAVREEQLAVLIHRVDAYEIEIRITTNIEADDVTWTRFLKFDVKPLESSAAFWMFLRHGIFFVDEQKKVALICENDFGRAYMIGEDNYFKLALVKSTGWRVMCSYVLSSVQIPKGPVDA